MSITEKEDDLFEKWKQQRPGLVGDGVVDENSYLKSKPKLLFVMKEVNDLTGGGWDLRDFIRQGARPQTWDNITRWVRGVRNLDQEISWSDIEQISKAQRKEILKSICVMNLKKSPGGGTTDDVALSQAAKTDEQYLKEQASLYNPDLIVCCGSVTGDLFLQVMCLHTGWKATHRGISFLEFEPGKHIISFSHPAARVQCCLLYYGLIDAVREIWKDSGQL